MRKENSFKELKNNMTYDNMLNLYINITIHM